jgi:ADP-ribose pyrophosphatase
MTDILNSRASFKRIGVRPLYGGQHRLDLVEHEVETATDAWRKTQYEIFDWKSSAVFSAPYDANQNLIALLREFKPAPDGHGECPWVLSTVAGGVKDNESPEDAIRRETREEIGIDVKRFRFAANSYGGPGTIGTKNSLYIAEVDLTQAAGIRGFTQENEETRVFICSPREAFALVAQGTIPIHGTSLALLWFQLHHKAVRRAWRHMPKPAVPEPRISG